MREILADYPTRTWAPSPMHHVVPRLLGTPGAIRSAAPAPGQHNRGLLSELGFDEKNNHQLMNAGIVSEGCRKETEEE